MSVLEFIHLLFPTHHPNPCYLQFQLEVACVYHRSASPDLHTEQLLGLLPNLLMHHVDLCLGQRALHVAVHQAVAVAVAAMLLVEKLVHQADLFHQVAPDAANHLVEIVGLEALRNPEGNVVGTLGVQTDGLEESKQEKLMTLEFPKIFSL